MDTARRIHDLRKKAGLTQVELARLIGTNQATVSDWERGATKPGPLLQVLAHHLNTTTDFLIRGRLSESVQPMADLVLHSGAALADAFERLTPERRAYIQGQIDLLRIGSENLPPGVVPGEPRSASRRHEIPVYHVSKSAPRHQTGVPVWLNLAAGPGGPLELTDNLLYFRELPETNGWHSAIVRGDSMSPTIQPGDVVLLDSLCDGQGLRLSSLEPGQPKSNLHQFRRLIHLDDVYVLQVNDEDPTLKRVRVASGSAGDWHLLLLADNLTCSGYPRIASRADTVTFLARLIGLISGNPGRLGLPNSSQSRGLAPKPTAKPRPNSGHHRTITPT